MINNFKTRLKNSTRQQKLALLIFCFTVITYTGLSLYVYSIDRQALDKSEQAFTFPVAFSDSEMYATLAKRMLSDHVFSVSTQAPFVPFTHWSPGYPLLLAGSYYLFDSPVPLVAVQILLSAFTAVLIFWMSLRFVPTRWAVIPSIIFSLDASIAFYSGSVFTDGLFMSLTTILLYLLFFYDQRKFNMLHYLALGLLLGVSALLRTISQYLVVVLPIIYLSWTYLTKLNPTKAALGMFMLVIGAVSVMAPWAERNHQVVGSYDLATNGSSMLLNYYIKDFLTLEEGTNTAEDFAQSDTADVIAKRIDNDLNKIVAEKGGTPLSHYKGLALSYISESPVSYLRFHIIGTLPYFLGGSYRHFFVSMLGKFQDQAGLPRIEHKNLAHMMTEAIYSGDIGEMVRTTASLSVVLVEVVWRILLVLLALLAIFATKGRERGLILMMWLFVGYFAFLTGPSSLTRYRIVTEPLLLTMATIGGWFAWQQLKFYYAKFRHSSRTSR